MSKFEKMEMHDGLLLDVDLSVSSKRLRVKISALESLDAKERKPFLLEFFGVVYFTVTADLGELDRNEFAGTIVDIRTQDDGKLSMIYLTGGILIVRCEKLTVQERDGPVKLFEPTE